MVLEGLDGERGLTEMDYGYSEMSWEGWDGKKVRLEIDYGRLEMNYDRLEMDYGRLEIDYDRLEMNYGRLEMGYIDFYFVKWWIYCTDCDTSDDYTDFWIARIGEKLGRGTKEEGRNSHYCKSRDKLNHEYTNEYKGARFAPFFVCKGIGYNYIINCCWG